MGAFNFVSPLPPGTSRDNESPSPARAPGYRFARHNLNNQQACPACLLHSSYYNYNMHDYKLRADGRFLPSREPQRTWTQTFFHSLRSIDILLSIILSLLTYGRTIHRSLVARFLPSICLPLDTITWVKQKNSYSTNVMQGIDMLLLKPRLVTSYH